MGLVQGLRSGWAGLALCLLVPSVATAQFFSPGALARAHADLEGISNCQKCHTAGRQLDPNQCLNCHRELKQRVDAGRGFHARIPSAERACERCHVEHQGRDAELVDFGKPGKRGFDHQRTGWPLNGGHRPLECAKCHEDRRIEDPAMVAYRKKWPRRETFLGLGTTCRACHFDEHRGQIGGGCDRCHDEVAFKPARGFDHQKTAYPLTGRHAKVACAKCHDAEDDRATPAQAFPAPKQATFARYQPLDHKRCTDCHADPHDGQFGRRCTNCHTTSGWRTIVAKKATDRDFHDKTKYPLRGEHEDVACKSCHGPLPGKPVRFKGLVYERCNGCHYDAHAGQLPADRDCGGCHDVDGFAPVKFDAEAHQKTDYPLAGAHKVVACSRCHTTETKLSRKFPAALARLLMRQRRPKILSTLLIKLGVDTARCESCHEDVHRGQFAEKVAATGCPTCHGPESFHEVKFDHDRDSRYPLTGAHREAACDACHVRATPDPAAPLVYKGTPTECRSCHRDEHRGQFDSGSPSGGKCENCHETKAFAPSLFDHADPTRTSFALEGRHAEAACETCHPKITVGTVTLSRYRPVPSGCAGCHVDVHHGAMKRFER